MEGFKSFGNPVCGTAYLMFFDLANGNDFSSATPKWTKKFPGYLSAKSIVEIPGTGYAFATSYGESPAAVITVDFDGNLLWQEKYASHGEVTDLALSGDFLFLTGHGAPNVQGGGIHGSLTKISRLDGAKVWTKHYGSVKGGKYQFSPDKNNGATSNGNPGNYVYEECWGIATTLEGNLALACGTGIEYCKGRPTKCKKDPRRNWRSLIIQVDPDGKVLWQRLDSFKQDGSNYNPGSSASEFVVATSDGGLFSTNDEVFGVGMLKLETPLPTTPRPTTYPTLFPSSPYPTSYPTLVQAYPTGFPTAEPSVYPTSYPS